MNLTFTGNQNLISLVAKGSEVLLESLDLPDGSLLLNLEEIPAGQEAFLKKEGSVCTLAFREPSQYFLLLKPRAPSPGWRLCADENSLLPKERLYAGLFQKCRGHAGKTGVP